MEFIGLIKMGEGEESKLGGEIDLLPIIDLMMQFMALLESKSYSEALKLSETSKKCLFSFILFYFSKEKFLSFFSSFSS